ncbi:hypothetical protein [Mycolicibacterium mucogenicum]|uniref:Uncharacterized protein n=1 Tax=Mycolicibacterium mucogenicum DSM 44124 TaxID=1226753 RepID=A0A8H2PEA0_MYCMU|nr:hypothetical protein [Mycolicibacterium mucogenicum]KAB7761179.1 hypothetical protein MMUC44124_00860 [Mycolicibacterium mucogenicum DSM 44124]QPG69985.1 hypothetical protein C1S78_002855 [Mycolicibacterium mucogenicum DSM 44124]
MATKVTIEGSRITPTDKLLAGHQRTVLLTPDVQNLIDRGFVFVVHREELPDAAPAQESEPEGEAPQDETDPDPEPTESAPKRGRRPRATDASE